MGLIGRLWGRRKANDPAVDRSEPASLGTAPDLALCNRETGESHGPNHYADGERLLSCGMPEQALASFQAALESSDEAALAHLGQARAYVALGRPEDARDSAEIAAAMDPSNIDALQLLGTLEREHGEPTRAVELIERALAAAPERGDLHFEHARALNRAGRIEAAIRAYREAIARDPADLASHNNLGLIHLQDLGEPQEAEALFRRVLDLAPTHDAGMLNLALALHHQGRHEEALALFEAARKLYPGHVELRWNEALALLSLGQYERGWQGYECRFSRPISRKLGQFPYGHWDGRPLAQGKLLVVAEQGLGDEIMFASCLHDVRGLASDLVLECAPRLASLFARSFPAIAVYGVERDAPLDWLRAHPDVSAMIPIGSLPRYVRTTRADFPQHGGYLVPDPKRVQAYRAHFAALGGMLKVGLSWRAGARVTHAALRSIALEQLQPLLALPNARFFSVQHGLNADERRSAAALGIEFVDDGMVDLDQAAAMFSALDIVVTVENTNAHLAGALGLPAWVLLGESPDWRWMRSGDRAPWYPSITLFRSEGRPRWANAVQQITQRLGRCAADRSIIRDAGVR